MSMFVPYRDKGIIMFEVPGITLKKTAAAAAAVNPSWIRDVVSRVMPKMTPRAAQDMARVASRFSPFGMADPGYFRSTVAGGSILGALGGGLSRNREGERRGIGGMILGGVAGAGAGALAATGIGAAGKHSRLKRLAQRRWDRGERASLQIMPGGTPHEVPGYTMRTTYTGKYQPTNVRTVATDSGLRARQAEFGPTKWEDLPAAAREAHMSHNYSPQRGLQVSITKPGTGVAGVIEPWTGPMDLR